MTFSALGLMVALSALRSVKGERILRSPPLVPLNGKRLVLFLPRGCHAVPDAGADWRTWQYGVTLYRTGRLKQRQHRERVEVGFWVTPQSRAQRNGLGVGKWVTSRQGLRGVYFVDPNPETGLVEENFAVQTGVYKYKEPQPGEAPMVVVFIVTHRKGAPSRFRALLEGFRIEPAAKQRPPASK